MAQVLFVSYDGLMEPLGQSQIHQYLVPLSREHSITLLSFEKSADLGNAERFTRVRAEAAAAGIHWVPLRYHKRPAVLSTAFDLALGLIVGAWLVFRDGVRIVHARSYPPAVIALALKRTLGVRFVFDMRGFWADQRVDCGAWPRGRLFRVAKWFERKFLVGADIVLSETKAAVEVMKEFDYLKAAAPRWGVVSTCTNLALFRPTGERRPGPFTVGCVGSLGVWYLFDRMLESFKILKELRPDARLLIVNQGAHEFIRERLREGGVPDSCVELKAADFHEVASEYARMDVGLFYLKPCYSLAAVCPTKLGEFLASGVPCLTNDGVGDATEILEGEGAGVVLRSFAPDEQRRALSSLLELAGRPETSARCVEAARRHFDLAVGLETIASAYRSLSEAAPVEGAARR